MPDKKKKKNRCTRRAKEIFWKRVKRARKGLKYMISPQVSDYSGCLKKMSLWRNDERSAERWRPVQTGRLSLDIV